MNHDYEHCADFDKSCPRDCFRAQLVRDLRARAYLLPVSWMHFNGPEDCKKENLK